ncbi:phosphoprotein [Fox fecal rhabdovirus]|uniref:Phosphoprotein n=1 Tax=Fox fecal rhabdovirus TaxID=1504569 RepID=A0A060D4P0_9RHAB|nr:phosphoprotein [Fox fecal rhabdovirus]AIB06806.1 phosphoprotein [Fox fecal rhabdovirus]
MANRVRKIHSVVSVNDPAEAWQVALQYWAKRILSTDKELLCRITKSMVAHMSVVYGNVKLDCDAVWRVWALLALAWMKSPVDGIAMLALLEFGAKHVQRLRADLSKIGDPRIDDFERLTNTSIARVPKKFFKENSITDDTKKKLEKAAAILSDLGKKCSYTGFCCYADDSNVGDMMSRVLTASGALGSEDPIGVWKPLELDEKAPYLFDEVKRIGGISAEKPSPPEKKMCRLFGKKGKFAAPETSYKSAHPFSTQVSSKEPPKLKVRGVELPSLDEVIGLLPKGAEAAELLDDTKELEGASAEPELADHAEPQLTQSRSDYQGDQNFTSSVLKASPPHGHSIDCDSSQIGASNLSARSASLSPEWKEPDGATKGDDPEEVECANEIVGGNRRVSEEGCCLNEDTREEGSLQSDQHPVKNYSSWAEFRASLESEVSPKHAEAAGSAIGHSHSPQAEAVMDSVGVASSTIKPLKSGVTRPMQTDEPHAILEAGSQGITSLYPPLPVVPGVLLPSSLKSSLPPKAKGKFTEEFGLMLRGIRRGLEERGLNWEAKWFDTHLEGIAKFGDPDTIGFQLGSYFAQLITNPYLKREETKPSPKEDHAPPPPSAPRKESVNKFSQARPHSQVPTKEDPAPHPPRAEEPDPRSWMTGKPSRVYLPGSDDVMEFRTNEAELDNFITSCVLEDKFTEPYILKPKELSKEQLKNLLEVVSQHGQKASQLLCEHLTLRNYKSISALTANWAMKIKAEMPRSMGIYFTRLGEAYGNAFWEALQVATAGREGIDKWIRAALVVKANTARGKVPPPGWFVTTRAKDSDNPSVRARASALFKFLNE